MSLSEKYWVSALAAPISKKMRHATGKRASATVNG